MIVAKERLSDVEWQNVGYELICGLDGERGSCVGFNDMVSAENTVALILIEIYS